jgi:hypothetical protein
MIFILIFHSVSLIPIYTLTLITLRSYSNAFLVHNVHGLTARSEEVFADVYNILYLIYFLMKYEFPCSLCFSPVSE